MDEKILEFDSDVNQYNKKSKTVSFIKAKTIKAKSKIPVLTGEKITLRFMGFIIISTLILSYMVSSMYILPYVFPHKPVIIPEKPGNYPVNDSNILIILPESTPVPITVTVKPVSIIKSNSTPVPKDIINSGYIIGGSESPTIKPLTGDDYNHVLAQERNILYTDGLALNIYNQTDLGLSKYHTGDKALIKINTYNNLNEPVTNLKAYITVKMLDTGLIPVKDMLIGDINVNIPSGQNYLSSYNINIPNYKGSYGITVDVKGNDKKGFGVYWEIDIL